MNRFLQRPFWLLVPALIVVSAVADPASAQQECSSFERGRIPVDEVNKCFADLRTDVEELKSGSQASTEFNETLGRLGEQIDAQNAQIAALRSMVDTLSAAQPTIGEDGEFGTIYRPQRDGLVIAFFTAPADKLRDDVVEIQASIEALVDPRVEVRETNLDTDPRASDSFVANRLSKDRSATIVMPIRAGEHYQLNLTITQKLEGQREFTPVDFDPAQHVRGVHFVEF